MLPHSLGSAKCGGFVFFKNFKKVCEIYEDDAVCFSLLSLDAKKGYFESEQGIGFEIDSCDYKNDKLNIKASAFNGNENSEIICRDMVSYEEKVFFQPSANSGISLLGLTDAVTNQVEDGSGFYDITAMYIDSSGDAYIVCNNQLCKLDGGKIIPILKNYIYTLCYDGNKVYFVDIARDFFVCNSDGSNLRKIG